MRLSLVFPVLLAVGSVAAPAQVAQEQPWFEDNSPEARLAIESYGKCVAEHEPRESRRLLTMDFTSVRYRTAMRLLSEEARRDCALDSIGFGNVMRSDGLLFSGAIAEALLEAEPTPLNARLVRGAAAEVPSFAPTGAVALCLARSLPDQVAALLASAPGSDGEAAAAAPLSQAIPACARTAGIKTRVELTVPAVRAIVATAAYRLLASSEDAHA